MRRATADTLPRRLLMYLSNVFESHVALYDTRTIVKWLLNFYCSPELQVLLVELTRRRVQTLTHDATDSDLIPHTRH